MKKIILISAVVLFTGLTGFAQTSVAAAYGLSRDLNFEVRGNYSRAIKKEILNKAQTLNDIIPYYPENWISDYISVEILATSNGKAKKAIGENNTLTAEQKNILSSIDLGSDLVINVKYKFNEPISNDVQNNKMHVVMTVVPETHAEYVNGAEEMNKYLKVNAIDKIPEPSPQQFQQSVVLFTVNEVGEITNAKISKASGDSRTDNILLDAINKMPKWKPAKNSKGINVKQEFKFTVGNGGC